MVMIIRVELGNPSHRLLPIITQSVRPSGDGSLRRSKGYDGAFSALCLLCYICVQKARIP